jgi:ATP-dependent Clp protease ATP-binding subunit ClpC
MTIATSVRRALRKAARRVSDSFEAEPHSRMELISEPMFEKAVEQVRGLGLSTDDLISLCSSEGPWIARIVLPVLAERDDIPDRWVSLAIKRLEPAPWDLAGLLLLSLEKAPGEVIGKALESADDVDVDDLAALISARVESGGETVDEELVRRHLAAPMTYRIQELVETAELPAGVRQTFARWLETVLDLGEAGRSVKLWTRPFANEPVLIEGRRMEVAEELVSSLLEEPPCSVMLVGEHGVGKSMLARAALEGLPEGWIVIEAGAAAIVADTPWVSQLEARIEELVSHLRGRRVVWVFPAFEEALWAGVYMNHPTGLLDLLLPHVEAGTIRIVAEITPASYELLVANRPRAQSAFRALRIRSLTEAETVSVLRHALEQVEVDVEAEESVLLETVELSQQFLPEVAQPGGSMRLLRATVDDVLERQENTFGTGDVLSSLAALSGLPLVLLDPQRPLDLDVVGTFFGQHVLGQEEAVRAMIDRIALIKAGLTDPTRPLGVYLFVGPTGTGKTELAKTLAAFMFGSAGRLVRLDMSEFQTPDSLERLLGDTSLDSQGSPLIASVRRDPFSVVLLDEFEKAAAPIWDLFLQIFDDGRLTDRSGRTADFRRCIIILTSNVGSALQAGPSVGFVGDDTVFRPREIERALGRTFRAEFLNRIDKVVVFRPFGREQMRALLDKELDEVVSRRGLRARPWTMEVDETAVTFLLEAGFSPTLGARPLKRAVEQHLLTPLARAIVDARVPEGEQFLFVTAPHDRIEVQFVGLEDASTTETAPREAAEEALEVVPTDGGEELRALLRGGQFSRRAQHRLLADLEEIETRLRNEIVEAKQVALDLVSSPGFWEDEGRFQVLAEAEYLDRFEAAANTASKLGNRLSRHLERVSNVRGDNANDAAELCELLGTRIYALASALQGIESSAPFELFVLLRVVGTSQPDSDQDGFLSQLVGMYFGWAERRGMHVSALRRSDEEALLFVSGLGAWVILQPETGLHVYELADADGRDGPSVERVSVSVQIAACEPSDRSDPGVLTRQANGAFAGARPPAQVVRRYRAAPSPLVRDAVRGYRTGRLDRVLAGDFDLY